MTSAVTALFYGAWMTALIFAGIVTLFVAAAAAAFAWGRRGNRKDISGEEPGGEGKEIVAPAANPAAWEAWLAEHVRDYADRRLYKDGPLSNQALEEAMRGFWERINEIERRETEMMQSEKEALNRVHSIREQVGPGFFGSLADDIAKNVLTRIYDGDKGDDYERTLIEMVAGDVAKVCVALDKYIDPMNADIKSLVQYTKINEDRTVWQRLRHAYLRNWKWLVSIFVPSLSVVASAALL